MSCSSCKAGLKFGTLEIPVPLAMAPMVGLSHSAFRSLLLELGGVGLLFTEMLAATRLPHENEHVSPMLIRSESEKPLIYQMFLHAEEHIGPAVRKLEAVGADGVDLNLGCPAPQLRRTGSGGFLAENHELVRRIVCGLRRSTALPLSAKIRLGRTLDKERLIDFTKMLEDSGIDLLTVHGRLHGEKFCRVPRWDWIGVVKDELTIPVMANGGIFTVGDARKCLERSGADGLMIGRGGIERPWLFTDIGVALYGQDKGAQIASRQEVFYLFTHLLEERFRIERRLGRLKQFTHYFAKCFTFGHQLASSIQTSKSMEEAIERAGQFFQQVSGQEVHY